MNLEVKVGEEKKCFVCGKLFSHKGFICYDCKAKHKERLR